MTRCKVLKTICISFSQFQILIIQIHQLIIPRQKKLFLFRMSQSINSKTTQESQVYNNQTQGKAFSTQMGLIQRPSETQSNKDIELRFNYLHTHIRELQDNLSYQLQRNQQLQRKYKTQIEGLTSHNSKLRLEMKDIELKMQRIVQKENSLQIELDQKNTTINQQTISIKKLDTEIKNLQNIITNLKQGHMNQIDRLIGRFNNLQHRLIQQEEQIRQLQQQIRIQRNQNIERREIILLQQNLIRENQQNFQERRLQNLRQVREQINQIFDQNMGNEEQQENLLQGFQNLPIIVHNAQNIQNVQNQIAQDPNMVNNGQIGIQNQ